MRAIKMFEATLYSLKTTENYRPKITNVHFNFMIGYTINVSPLGFPTPHNIEERSHYRVCTTDPLDRNIEDWKKIIWIQAKKLLSLYDPKMASSEYCIQVTEINSPEHYVKWHNDPKDIGPQYIMYFGDYRGVYLETFSPSQESYGFYWKPYLLLKFDGRLYHQVHLVNFTGRRFALGFFQLYCSSQTQLADIFFPPEYVK
jgi:hypothetical protein